MGIPPVKIGDLVAEKYLVDSVVGEGGMGVVVAARHLQLDQRVAIKFLLPEIARQGMAAERFRREARSAARIRGEHVCRVLDVGTHADGVPFMVMEYLDGCDLAAEIERRGRLPAEEVVDYVLQACEALAEAHVAGIVHRDLKPANLFLTTRSDGSKRVKVLDFGVSKSLLSPDSGQMSLTTTQTFVGSPFYMSPEQLDSAKDVDARTDIWALGVVFYELLTGRTPFAGESIPRLVSAVLNDSPPSLASVGVDAPEGLEPALLRALHKQRTERYATIAEFAEAIAPFAPPHATTASLRVARVLAGGFSTPTGERPIPKPTVSEGVKRSATPWSWMRGGTAVQRSRRRREIAAGLTLLLLLLGFAAYRLWSGAPAGKAHEHVVSIPPQAAPSPSAEKSQPPGRAATAQPPAALPSGVAAPAPVEASAAPAVTAPAAAPAPATSEPSAPAEAPQPAAKASESSHAKARRDARANAKSGDTEPPANPRPRRVADTLPDFGGRR